MRLRVVVDVVEVRLVVFEEDIVNGKVILSRRVVMMEVII